MKITPVPGIWTSGPSAGSAMCESEPNLPGLRVEKGPDLAAGIGRAERRVAAGFDAAAGIERVLAQRDVLARNTATALCAKQGFAVA
jgi:hypothetical protein